jgi:sporulation protein YlmC with PRC-barrel domain
LVSGIALGAGTVLAESTPTASGPTTAVHEVTTGTFVGAPVYDSTGAMIGEISEIVTDTTTGQSRVLVDMGGVLGMGEHTVAVAFDDLNVILTEDGKIQTLTILRTAAELDALPNYGS